MFDLSGIGSGRLHLAWVSSAEAQRFVEVVKSTVEAVKAAGKFDPSLFTTELAAAEMTLSGEKVRWMIGKEVKITTQGDVYGNRWDVETYESILDSALEREFHKNLIFQAIKAGAKSVRDISRAIGLELSRVSYLLADMEKTNMVEFKGMEDCKPVFATLS